MDLMAMEIVVPVVSGAVQGCVYGLLGLGLVLLYKSGRIFNFAQAEMGAFAAFMTAFADAGTGPFPNLPVWAAILIGMVTGILLGLLVERLVIRPLFSAPKVTVVVATAGVFLFLYAVEGFLSGPGPRQATRIIDGNLLVNGGLRITKLGGVIVIVLGFLLVAAEAGMDQLSDYTFRGTMTLPDDPSSPLGGREVLITAKVTADGRCQTVITVPRFGNAIRRTIDGTTYQQFSDEFLDKTEMDQATKRMLRGHWTAQPDEAATTCDAAELSRAVDLYTARELGSSVIRGVDVVGFEGHATSDARVEVRFWLSTGDDARVVRISGGIGGVDSTVTLVSEDDEFTIEEPQPGRVLHQQ